MKTSIISLFTYKELTKIIKCHNLHETAFVKGTKNDYNYNKKASTVHFVIKGQQQVVWEK